MISKKLLSLFLAGTLCLTVFVGCKGNTDKSTASEAPTIEASASTPVKENTSSYGLSENIEDGAILHCFSWSFNTIAESMEDIAMAGYSAIQTSPINACYDGGTGGMELFGDGKWYYHYQPTDWTIGNYQLGTKEEFMAMCETAHRYGIKVIVDVAPNHTTPNIDEVSSNLIDAVGGVENLYHSKGFNDISDYTDRTQCTLRAVGGLYDANTENAAFQDYFISYINDCIACGADGFRYDTAKHIGLSDDPQDDSSLPNNFWDRVLTEIDNADSIFNYGEVLQDGGERIADYIETIGATTASNYGSKIRDSLQTSLLYADRISNLVIKDAEPNVVTWVESHDNYTGDDATYTYLDNEDLILGWTIITARETGTPLFFSRPYGSSSTNMWGTFNCIGMAGDNLYKNPAVVAVNRFRNAMSGLGENIFNPDDSDNVAFIERGTKGLAIINADDSDYTFETAANLEDGEYINRADTSVTYTVKDGIITGIIKSKSTAILYNDGYIELEAAAVVKVSNDTVSAFNTDTLDVTLLSENTDKAEYSVNGSEATAYKNGDVITIGAETEAGNTVKLTLTASNADGNKTCISYIFKKQAVISEGTVVYFEKPANWGSSLYAYVYDESSSSSVKQNAAWPGEAMALESDGTYSYTITGEWNAALIIFNDGVNQSNKALEPGEAVEEGKLYTVK